MQRRDDLQQKRVVVVGGSSGIGLAVAQQAASQGAKERVKVAFLLQKIAEKEDIKVSQEEIAQRINYLAANYQIPAEKFLKDLQKRNGLIEIYDQVMNEKVIDLLQQNAKIEEVPPGTDMPNPS